MSDAFWTTAGLVILAIIALINLVLMFWMTSLKERRQDERQRVADERADERAHQLVTKVEEVKEVAVVAADNAQTIARNTSNQQVESREAQTEEIKDAIKKNGIGP